MRDQERSPAITAEREAVIRELVVAIRGDTEVPHAYPQPDEAADALEELLEALAVLGRQLAEKDEALREALRLRNEAYVSTPVRGDTRNAHFALQALGQILREALRAEPAKEEA